LFGQGLRFVADSTGVPYQSSPLGEVFDAIEAPYEFQKFDLQPGKLLHFSVRGPLIGGIVHRLSGLSVGVLLWAFGADVSKLGLRLKVQSSIPIINTTTKSGRYCICSAQAARSH
jgi:hypothetical protein